MVLCRQLSTLLCAAVLVCILTPCDSQIGIVCPTAGCTVIANSECANGTCVCKQGFYNDHGSDCLAKKGLGAVCTSKEECQGSSLCEGGHCVSASNASTGDKLLMISMFLLYLVVNRN
ncbi:uncharacterized protein LOC112566435 [Pomacea canaliculata]|uniref:uncharacterized protein LOC112566435 n=1 Tax=Pomacea canaliculata TaxID=400727 RepID=UPI000D73FEE7|nr:uncharacterized protein LOC112566435 [Pomacea canaliculata]